MLYGALSDCLGGGCGCGDSGYMVVVWSIVLMVDMGVLNVRWYIGMEVLNASWHIVGILLPITVNITTYYHNEVIHL